MNKKQIIGLIVAGVVFAFVGVSSAVTSYFTRSSEPTPSFLDSLASIDTDFSLPYENYIGVVDVQGTIMDTNSTSIFDLESYNHQKTLDLIDTYKNSSNNKGILLTVNSPGGSVYESDELYLKLLEYKNETERPVWAYFEGNAFSGAYYIAMASDNIVANRNNMTGSIGVIMGFGNYKELAEKIGYSEIYFTSGPNKTMGNAFSDVSEEQKTIFQSIVDESYDQFVDIVVDGRDLDKSTVLKIADGRIYTAQQSLNLDMIDGIDTFENTIAEFQKITGGAILFEPVEKITGFGSLFFAAKDLKPKSDAEIISSYFEKQGNGVPMYYAYPGQ